MKGPALGGAGPNWEQYRSAQVPSQFAPRSVELVEGPTWGVIGPIGLRPALVHEVHEVSFLYPTSSWPTLVLL